jgi:RNA polymerase sigma factor (sigma-70 family)
MADSKPDPDLLRDYVQSGSESSFSLLVHRHLALVYSIVLRSSNNHQAAEELAQNVFVLLARKAPWLLHHTSLAGWLHTTAILEARAWWRGELRRRDRQKQAIDLGTTMNAGDPELKRIAAELDDALLSLSQEDRQAILLRYVEGRSHREVGLLLNAQEDTVRMRTNKAVARLAQWFQRRGFKVASIAALTALLEQTVTPAPAGFAAAVSKTAVSVGSSGALGFLKGALVRYLTLPKAQTGILCALVAFLPPLVQWKTNQAATRRLAALQSLVELNRESKKDLLARIDQLGSRNAAADRRLAEADATKGQSGQIGEKLRALKSNLSAFLQTPGLLWPSNLPYIRVPKKTVHALDLLHKSPLFDSAGKLTEQAVEMLAITSDELAAAETILGNYLRGIDQMTLASAYATNSPPEVSGRTTWTIIIPPLGSPLKDLAQATKAELSLALGEERADLLFGDWDQGAVQTFWPGNVWNIAVTAQSMSMWVQPSLTNTHVWFGATRGQGQTGMGSSGNGSLMTIPATLFDRFLRDWATQQGVPSTQFPKQEHHE